MNFYTKTSRELKSTDTRIVVGDLKLSKLATGPIENTVFCGSPYFKEKLEKELDGLGYRFRDILENQIKVALFPEPAFLPTEYIGIIEKRQ